MWAGKGVASKKNTNFKKNKNKNKKQTNERNTHTHTLTKRERWRECSEWTRVRGTRKKKFFLAAFNVKNIKLNTAMAKCEKVDKG